MVYAESVEGNNMKKTLVVLSITMALSGIALAQVVGSDNFYINYYANANTAGAPDATVRIDNPGLTYTDVCAMVYVFTPDQQMAECCGCRNSHNNLRTLSVNFDLARNPLTGVPQHAGAIKIVSASLNGAACDPSSNVTPLSDLRAWATHIQNRVGSSWPITETEFSNTPLGATELANLQAQCAFIGILGSGHGVCSCGTGT
jgi:hypothetical protein